MGAEAKQASAPGRPPDPEADRRIMEAAKKLIAVEGFSRMSIEGVAAEAGVAKTTIYRRWPSKAALVTAAIADLLPVATPETTGSAYDDLVTQLEHNRRTIEIALPGTLLAEEGRNPELLATFRERVLRPRVAFMRGILEAGVERGQVRDDADLDATLDMVMGAFLFHYLANGRPDEAWPQRIADTIWPALAAP
jgi:AcrR family transcriptional regulator